MLPRRIIHGNIRGILFFDADIIYDSDKSRNYLR